MVVRPIFWTMWGERAYMAFRVGQSRILDVGRFPRSGGRSPKASPVASCRLQSEEPGSRTVRL